MTQDKVLMPKALTAENGAKYAMIGEFKFHPYRDYEMKVDVPWDTIKEIYAFAVKHFGEALPDDRRDQRIQELLENNNKLLERARIAEWYVQFAQKPIRIIHPDGKTETLPSRKSYLDGLRRALVIANRSKRGKTVAEALKAEICKEEMKAHYCGNMERKGLTLSGIREMENGPKLSFWKRVLMWR